MKYPKTLNVKVENIFGDQDVQITLYSGLTIFVGTNASGKTQTLKKIRDIMRNEVGSNKVRDQKQINTIIPLMIIHLEIKRQNVLVYKLKLQVEISLQWTNERMFLLRYLRGYQCYLIEIFLFAGMLDK